MTSDGAEVIDGTQFMAEAQTEVEFMRHVMAYAKAQGWLVYHTHISKRSTEGWPDLAMVRRGRLVLAELKREKGGRVSPAQQRWIDELQEVELYAMHLDVGGKEHWPVEVFIWRPSDWPEIERVLA